MSNTQKRSFIVYPDSSFCETLALDIDRISIEGADLSTVKAVDVETGKSVRFDIIPLSWSNNVSVTERGSGIIFKGRLLEKDDRTVKLYSVESNDNITVKYDRISEPRLNNYNDESYILILPDHGQFKKGVKVSYNTNVLTWMPIINVDVSADGGEALWSMQARIKSNYETPILSNIKLVMKEAIRREFKQERLTRSSMSLTASPSSNDDQLLLESPYGKEIDLDELLIAHITTVPVSEMKIGSDRSDVIDLHLHTEDGKATTSLVSFATEYVPSARYNISDYNVRNSYNLNLFQSGERMVLPISTSHNIRFSNIVSTVEDRVVEGLAGTRIESTLYNLKVVVTNSLGSDSLITLSLKPHGEVMSISPQPGKGSDGTTFYWDMMVRAQNSEIVNISLRMKNV